MKTELFNHTPVKAITSEELSHPTGARGTETNDLNVIEGKSYIVEGYSKNDIFVLLEDLNSNENSSISQHIGSRRFYLSLEEYIRLFGNQKLTKTYQVTPQSLQDISNLDELLGGYQLYSSYPSSKQVNDKLVYKPIYVDRVLRVVGVSETEYIVRFDKNRILILGELAEALTGINQEDE